VGTAGKGTSLGRYRSLNIAVALGFAESAEEGALTEFEQQRYLVMKIQCDALCVCLCALREFNRGPRAEMAVDQSYTDTRLEIGSSRVESDS
jgi:hypothetical protein